MSQGAQVLFTPNQKPIPARSREKQRCYAEIIDKIITHKLSGEAVKDVWIVQRMRLGFDIHVSFYIYILNEDG